MFFGLAIIAFVSFYKDLFFSRFSKPLIAFLSLLYVSGLVLVSIVFVGAQTRAAVLAMDAVFVFSLVHFFVCFYRKNCQKSIAMLFVVYFLLSSVALFSLTNSVLHKRGSETLVTEKLATGDISNIPMTSFGVRLNSWIEASKWIKEKLVQGWGGGVRGYVMQQSNFSEAFKKNFGHFHNSYVEFTLAYGLIGLFYIFFIYFWVNRKIYLLSIKNPQFSGVWYFTLYGSLFMGIINIVESYVFFRTGVYATAILLAPAYTLYLADVYARLNPKQEYLL